MVAPLIPDMPPAPNRTQGGPAFSATADTFVAALQPLVVAINNGIAWMNSTMATTEGFKNAAATSASNAAASASSAATVGGQAVTAAQAARDAAAASALSAQASAEAAGASANFPNFVDPLDVLMVNQTKTGVKWGKVGHAIGDVLETTRTPDATYLLPDTVYSRAAYPDLFALVGIQGEKDDGVNPTTITHGLDTGAYTIRAGKDDVLVAIRVDTTNSNTSGAAGRSIDKGLTWLPIPSLVGGYSLKSLATDGNGTWVATMQRADNAAWVARSVDNGATWSTAALTVGYTYNGVSPVVAYDRVSKFIIYTLGQTASTRGAVSTNGGASWTEIVLPSNIRSFTVDFSGNLYVVIGINSTREELRRAPIGTTTFSLILGIDMPTSSAFGSVAHGQGVSAFVLNGQLFVSTDGGKQWSPKIVASTFALNITPYGYIVIRSSQALLMSSDLGETWYERPIGGLQLAMSGNITTDGVVVTDGSNTTFLRSVRLYNYDITSQFKTPARKAPKGYKAYIKGKLL